MHNANISKSLGSQWQDKPIPLAQFVEHVNEMHANRDDLFEDEFSVSQRIKIITINYSINKLCAHAMDL